MSDYHKRLYAAWLAGLQFHPGYPHLRLVKLPLLLLNDLLVDDPARSWAVVHQGGTFQCGAVVYYPFCAGDFYTSATEALRTQLQSIDEYERDACNWECPDD